MSQRSISHGGQWKRFGNIFKFKIKTRQDPTGTGEPWAGEGSTEGTGFYLLAERYYRAELFFIPGGPVGRGEGEWRGNRPLPHASRWLVLLRYLSAPHLPVPRENAGENEEGLSTAFAIFLSPHPLSLSLSSFSPGWIRISVRSDKRGLDRAEVIRETTM